MSKEILYDESMLMLLGKKTAEERLASLLLNLSGRFGERGFSPTEFHLHMSRNDIGNYLGLAVETVSRLFTRFQEQKLLEVSGKHIKLLDLPAMQNLVCSSPCHEGSSHNPQQA
jgi:CRP/FNR family transcriptional regulator